jgi:hypothetical protein
MRIGIALLIFLVLFNGWAGLLQDWGIDGHIGITAETGDPQELDRAVDASSEFRTGSSVGGTLLGMYNALGSTVESMFVGIQPGAQMLINIAPDGPAEDFVLWVYSIMEILMAADLLAYWRGADL